MSNNLFITLKGILSHNQKKLTSYSITNTEVDVLHSQQIHLKEMSGNL